jgi:two-component system osmolarity sensor histidine kinase EnvZ
MPQPRPRGIAFQTIQLSIGAAPRLQIDRQRAQYGTQVNVALSRDRRFARIVVGDKPDRSRAPRGSVPPVPSARRRTNLQAGGVGQGHAIARDLARGHGGDVLLDTSPKGGLRATIRLPA